MMEGQGTVYAQRNQTLLKIGVYLRQAFIYYFSQQE